MSRGGLDGPRYVDRDGAFARRNDVGSLRLRFAQEPGKPPKRNRVHEQLRPGERQQRFQNKEVIPVAATKKLGGDGHFLAKKADA
jgi:hypothetical protein